MQQKHGMKELFYLRHNLARADTIMMNEISFIFSVTYSTQRNLLKANTNLLRENELMRGCLTFAKRTKLKTDLCGDLFWYLNNKGA